MSTFKNDLTVEKNNTKGKGLWYLLNMPMTSYYLVLTTSALLAGLGVLMVFSSSSVFAVAKFKEGSAYHFVYRQIGFLIVGAILAFMISRLSTRIISVLSWYGLALSLLLLIGTTGISSLRRVSGGNSNWISIGGFTLQPSEFAKFILIIWVAGVFANKEKTIKEVFSLLFPFMLFVPLIIGLVLAEGDLGTAIILSCVSFALLWFVGAPYQVLSIIGVVSAAVVIIMVNISSNRLRRISVFLNPASNPDLASQPTASLYALASGGWWGVGLGASRQKWGMLKNQPHTDFVFAVLGEEFGLVGVLVTVAIIGVLAYAGIRIAIRSDRLFCRIAAAGITSWFIIQSVVNIFVVLKLAPVLGVPLPFISYGGSALLSSLMGVGVLLCCARNEPDARKLLADKKNGANTRITSVVDPRGMP